MKTLLLALLVLPLVAAVQIEQIYYDAQDESASEYILLSTTTQIDLTDYTIATPTSEQDATLIGTITDTYLITDLGWDQGKDNASWPASDHQEAIILPNTAGHVKLINPQGQIVDLVGYGNTNESQGTPHPGVQEGQALTRTGQTNNNSEDFVSAAPFEIQTPSKSGNGTNVEVSIENVPPQITNISVPDESDQEGIELMPEPQQNRNITINVSITDNNSLQGLSVRTNAQTITLNQSVTNTTISMVAHINTSTTTITVWVEDGEHEVSYSIPIQLIDIVALDMPTNIQINARPGEQQNTTLSVQNIGTTPVDLHILGTTPTFSANLLGDVRYTLGGQQYALTENVRIHSTDLSPLEHTRLDMHITPGYVPAGLYTGQIIIVGVPR